MQSYWSYSSGQCDYWEQLLPLHLSCRMCNQCTFHHQFGIHTWSSTFEQQTDSVLSSCGSHGQESQGSWYDRFECTASCTIHAWSMEETSGRSIFGRHQSCYEERIEVLSDSIERHHFSWNITSFFVFRKLLGCKLEKSYTKKYTCHLGLHQRSLWNTTGKENWVRKLLDNQKGKLLDNHKEKLLDKQNFFQPTQPTPNPIRDRSGLPDDTLHTAEAQDSSRVCSVHESDTLNGDDEVLCKRMENPLLFMTRIMNQWWWTSQTWISEFQDYHIPLWNMRKVPAFENWFGKLRTTQIDMLFNKIYDKTKPTTSSVQSKKDVSGRGQRRAVWIAWDGPQNAVQSMLFILEWRHRLLHMRAPLKRNSGQSRFHWIYIGPSFGSRIRHQEGKTSRPYPITWKRDAWRRTTKESMTGSCEIMSSVGEWLKTDEMKKFVVHGTFLQMKITPIIRQKKNTFTTRPPGFLPLPPSRGRTRCWSPLFVLPVRNGLELVSSSFLVYAFF